LHIPYNVGMFNDRNDLENSFRISHTTQSQSLFKEDLREALDEKITELLYNQGDGTSLEELNQPPDSYRGWMLILLLGPMFLRAVYLTLIEHFS